MAQRPTEWDAMLSSMSRGAWMVMSLGELCCSQVGAMPGRVVQSPRVNVFCMTSKIICWGPKQSVEPNGLALFGELCAGNRPLSKGEPGAPGYCPPCCMSCMFLSGQLRFLRIVRRSPDPWFAWVAVERTKPPAAPWSLRQNVQLPSP